MTNENREKRIYRVTIKGSIVNTVLMIFKFVAGFAGGSAAMIADAVHSLSDFLTDIVVLVFVKISSKPQDDDHKYGHGKYETLATILIGIALMAVGAMIFLSSADKIYDYIQDVPLESPGIIALIAAIVSIILKEWTYHFTKREGEALDSPAVIANAWHHRSDALSSIGTATGIGGAILLGSKWAVLDPIAAVIVSVFIFKTAYTLISDSLSDLLERCLPKEVEDEIISIAQSMPDVSNAHNLRTRRIGSNYAIEMHIRMPGDTPLHEAHETASAIERQLRDKYGSQTHISLHVEPNK